MSEPPPPSTPPVRSDQQVRPDSGLPKGAPVTHVRQIAEFTFDLIEQASSAGPDALVETCGEWTMADLTHHLYSVQHFWTHVVSGRPSAGPKTYDRPLRVEVGALKKMKSTTKRLVAALDGVPRSEQAWTWSDDHTIDFIVRRQVHEALIHSIDGRLAAGSPARPIPAELAADGIDELVNVMMTDTPDEGTFEASGPIVRIGVTEYPAHWTLQLGRAVVETQRGPAQLPAAELLANETPADLELVGSGHDLLLWLWGRSDPQIEGLETEAAEELRNLVADSTAS